MCTGIWLNKGKGYFGRTLDYDFSYGEEVVITPKNFAFDFRYAGRCKSNFAMVGTAHVKGRFPLYYEAMNERGLCMAGLNFVGNAHYCGGAEGKKTVEQFELIPYLLGKCASVDGVIYELSGLRIGGGSFDGSMPVAMLHWLIADGEKCIVAESVEEGLKIYENPTGVLTNNPTFDRQLFNLNNYRNLSATDGGSLFGGGLDLQLYSRGMGAIGLPGDWSSQSRFVRAAFVRANSVCGDGEEECVKQFFHVTDTVSQPSGSCRTAEGIERTIYTCCCSQGEKIYYFKTYDSPVISAVRLDGAAAEGDRLYRYPHDTAEWVRRLN